MCKTGEARAIVANKSVKTAPSLMNIIMVFAVGRRGRDGCTGERKNAKLVREGRKEPLLYTLDTHSGVFVKIKKRLEQMMSVANLTRSLRGEPGFVA